jgi:hypothetical protein
MLQLTEGSEEIIYADEDGQIEPGENSARGELVDLFVRCRSKIEGQNTSSDSFEEFVQKNRDLVESWLDGYYVYPQLHAIPAMISRTLLLARLEAISTPSQQTNLYISEATRCYIHGFMLAAVAVTRAAFEQALKERLAQLHGTSYEGFNLGRLIRIAKKRGDVLTQDLLDMAAILNEACNQVMHTRPARNDDDALAIMDGIRFLIRELYSR